MNFMVKKLKADIQTQELIKKSTQKPKQLERHTFDILPDSNLITLNQFQRAQLLKSLEMYFPDLYVAIEFTKVYNIECETELNKFLKVLDDEMSEDKHFSIYKDCKTPEYDFLRQLRLRYMTK